MKEGRRLKQIYNIANPNYKYVWRNHASNEAKTQSVGVQCSLDNVHGVASVADTVTVPPI